MEERFRNLDYQNWKLRMKPVWNVWKPDMQGCRKLQRTKKKLLLNSRRQKSRLSLRSKGTKQIERSANGGSRTKIIIY